MAVAAPIDDSFYAAGRDAGLSPQILAEMIRLLSWDVDFQRDLHPGDRLEVVYQRLLDEDGEHVADGELDFVGLRPATRVIEAYRHIAGEGRSDFYDRQGRSLRKWLLRTPVDGARLSSGFGARRHPILGYTRLHRGIDFAAPKGTPVLAAGAGVVEAAGRNRGYGNYVRLRHNRDFVTAYAHLAAVRARTAAGSPGRARSGDRLVGATGLATGPHLHYELLERPRDRPDERRSRGRRSAAKRRAGSVLGPSRRDRPAAPRRRRAGRRRAADGPAARSALGGGRDRGALDDQAAFAGVDLHFVAIGQPALQQHQRQWVL